MFDRIQMRHGVDGGRSERRSNRVTLVVDSLEERIALATAGKMEYIMANHSAELESAKVGPGEILVAASAQPARTGIYVDYVASGLS